MVGRVRRYEVLHGKGERRWRRCRTTHGLFCFVGRINQGPVGGRLECSDTDWLLASRLRRRLSRTPPYSPFHVSLVGYSQFICPLFFVGRWSEIVCHNLVNVLRMFRVVVAAFCLQHLESYASNSLALLRPLVLLPASLFLPVVARERGAGGKSATDKTLRECPRAACRLP